MPRHPATGTAALSFFQVFYLYRAQRITSASDGFLPYIKIPTLYILAHSHIRKNMDMYRSASDSAISQNGTPKGRRTAIVIGDVNGIIDSQNARPDDGFCMADIDATIPIITGMVATEVSCDASCILSTAEPMAANIEE